MTARNSDAAGGGAAVVVATDVGEVALHAGCLVTEIIRADQAWWTVESYLFRELLRPGMSVVDIGAHVGYLSLLAASIVGPSGHVVAVEPEPQNCALLRRNLEVNRVESVEVVEGAAWSHGGNLPLARAEGNSGDHRTGASAPPGREIVQVQAFALDDVLDSARPVDLVKLDTQGTEHVALEGMRLTIARDRPTIISEFWPTGIREAGDDPVEVARFFFSLGLDVRMWGRDDLSVDSPAQDWVDAAEAVEPGFQTLVLTAA